MKQLLGDIAEGTVVKMYESGVLVDFVVAKHNYESGLNGTGHTLLCRTKVLDDKWPWDTCYSTSDPSRNINWKTCDVGSKPPTLRTKLENEYSTRFPEDVLAHVKPLTIRFYSEGSTTSKLNSAKFFVPSTGDISYSKYGYNSYGDQWSSAALAVLEDTAKGTCWSRDTEYDETSNGSGVTWEYGKVYTVGSTYSYSSKKYEFGIGSSTEKLTRTDYKTLPCFALYDDMILGDDGILRVNTAPSTPGSISVPSSIMGGTNITISWGTSSDAEDNLAGYKVERSINGGSSWVQIYQGTATITTDNVAFGTTTVMYRVKAYDTEGLESDWRTSSQVTVINNHAPSAPAYITVPSAVNGGSTLVISWTAASDSDGNLSGYILERSTDGGSTYTQVYKGSSLTYTDTITKGWTTVMYRVKAYDSYDAQSGYTTSEKRTVNNNTSPTITTSSAANLGTKSSGFTISYSVDDEDAGDTLTVTEKLDGTTKRTFTATRKATNSFAVTGEYFQKITNGSHTLTVTVTDGKATVTKTFTFTKAVTAASITLAQPMTADAQITLCAITVGGLIPADAVFKVEVTNNGNDDSPVWEDATTEARNGRNHLFTNQTATKGFAFNFRVTAERGASGESGYIASIQGGFQ